MMRAGWWRLGVLLVLMSLALLGMIAQKQYTLNSGQLIRLETWPIDPRSLFRGDYVRLNYAINRLRPDELQGERDFVRHDRIYVELARQDSYWQPVALHRQHPLTDGETVVIRGRVRHVHDYWWNPQTRRSERAPNLEVRYGIENYFVAEGEGRELENLPRDTRMDILVAVDRRGNAGIKGVLINDQLRYGERLF